MQNPEQWVVFALSIHISHARLPGKPELSQYALAHFFSFDFQTGGRGLPFMASQDDSDGEGLSWAESLAAIVNCGMGVAFSGSDATESGGRIPPVPPPAEDDTASMVDNLLRCGGSEADPAASSSSCATTTSLRHVLEGLPRPHHLRACGGWRAARPWLTRQTMGQPGAQCDTCRHSSRARMKRRCST